jgi:stage III sporulation protein SpoIIIAA
MTGMRVFTDRPSQGPKILIIGEPGAGKTTQLKPLSTSTRLSTLSVEAKAGALAIGDLKVGSIRPRTWEDCRDIACAVGGPNPALPPSAAYSERAF